MPSPPLLIGLVFGGASGEHAVSIRSAQTVLRGLESGANPQRYRVMPLYIDRRGRWWPSAVAGPVLRSGRPASADDLPARDGPADDTEGFRGLPAGSEAVDVWFPVLHGPNGEDGTIQGLFTLMRQPFVGSGVLGSAVGMDKQAMKAAFAAAGLPQVPYRCTTRAELERDGEALAARIAAELGFPCFVKPANLGSSVGISRCADRAELLEGLRQASGYDPRLVVEQGVRARELECAVLGGDELQASVVGEIRFDGSWYDYESKYGPGHSQTVIPAELPPEVSERVRRLALAGCRAVAAAGLARMDFFYDEAAGQLWVNEINTLPGFTSQSMFPMLWQASGVPLDELVHRLITLARAGRME
jgi:D-alanine-D-alanine ligase